MLVHDDGKQSCGGTHSMIAHSSEVTFKTIIMESLCVCIHDIVRHNC